VESLTIKPSWRAPAGSQLDGSRSTGACRMNSANAMTLLSVLPEMLYASFETLDRNRGRQGDAVNSSPEPPGPLLAENGAIAGANAAQQAVAADGYG